MQRGDLLLACLVFGAPEEKKQNDYFVPCTSRAPSALKARSCAASRNHRPVYTSGVGEGSAMRSCAASVKPAPRKSSLHSSAENRCVFTASKSPHWRQCGLSR